MEDGRPNPGKGEIFAQVAQSGGAAQPDDEGGGAEAGGGSHPIYP